MHAARLPFLASEPICAPSFPILSVHTHPRPLGHREPPLLHLPPHLQPLPLTSSPSPILATQSDQASSLEPSQNFSPGKTFLEQSSCGQGGSGEGGDSSGSIRGLDLSMTGVNGAQEPHLCPSCREPQMAVEVLLAQPLHSLGPGSHLRGTRWGRLD